MGKLILAGLLISVPLFASANELVAFDSEEGNLRLQRAEAKVDFALLSNYFEPQFSGVFCGPTSAAIVLNARSEYSQRSRGTNPFFLANGLFVGAGFLPHQRYYEPEDVFADGAKTRAQLSGEPMMVNGQYTADYGLQLEQLADLFFANQQQVRKVVLTGQQTIAEMREDLRQNLNQFGDFVVVNYQRKALEQDGGGHISPLAAYDEASDSFLIMDVNPEKQPWVWVSTQDLYQAMNTFDTVENRGYVHVGPEQAAPVFK